MDGDSGTGQSHGSCVYDVKTMAMERSSRPEPGATGMVVQDNIPVPASGAMTGGYLVTKFSAEKRAKDNEIIASKHKRAEADLTAALL